MTFNLTVNLVVDQHFTESYSDQENDDGVDHVTDEVTHGLAGRVLLDLFLHDDLGWLRDGAGLTANQLGLVQGLDLGLDSLLLVQILVLEVDDGVAIGDKPGEDGNLILFLCSGS